MIERIGIGPTVKRIFIQSNINVVLLYFCVYYKKTYRKPRRTYSSLHLKHRSMLRHCIALLFDSNLNPFYRVESNLDFKDGNDSIIFSLDGVLSWCTCIKSNDSSLSSVMVDLIADKVLFNLENNLSASAVFTGNIV